MQKDLDTLQKWETKWSMEFHPQKCQLLRISHKKSLITSDYFIHNVKLQSTNAAKYLGITLDNQLNWNTHINNVYKKANNALAFLRRNMTACPSHVKKKCFESYVRPILEYGSSVWDLQQTSSN